MKRKTQNKNSNYSMAHVLYQKLGNDWYAFSEVDGDCFMTKVNPEDIDIPSDTKSTQSPENKKNNAA